MKISLINKIYIFFVFFLPSVNYLIYFKDADELSIGIFGFICGYIAVYVTQNMDDLYVREFIGKYL